MNAHASHRGLQELNPNWTHRLWTDAEAWELVRQHVPQPW